VSTTASIGTTVNGNGTASAAPTALYRPNFSQAFQRAAATGPYASPLFPTPPFSSGGMISNGGHHYVWYLCMQSLLMEENTEETEEEDGVFL
jgi:hypothetical protein